MADRDGIRDKIPVKKEVSTINRDVVVFTFFLFLSFGFWYINSLGKEVEADIRYPLRFINTPKDKVVADGNQSKLNLSLKGPGYTILKLRMSGSKPPVTVDLSKVTWRRVPDSKIHEYYILTAGLVKSLSVQIRSGCEVIAVRPDTLFFTLEKSASGDLPVSRKERK